jgi:hypothetical protein
MYIFYCKVQATKFLLCVSVSQLSTFSLCFCRFVYKPNSCDFFLSKATVLYMIKINLQIYKKHTTQPFTKTQILQEKWCTGFYSRDRIRETSYSEKITLVSMYCLFYGGERNAVIGVRSLAGWGGGIEKRRMHQRNIEVT